MLLDRREDRGHRVVHPDVDRPELALDARRGRVDCRGVGDVGLQDQRAAALGFDFAPGRLQAIDAPRNQADVGALPGKRAHGGAPYAG